MKTTQKLRNTYGILIIILLSAVIMIFPTWTAITVNRSWLIPISMYWGIFIIGISWTVIGITELRKPVMKEDVKKPKSERLKEIYIGLLMVSIGMILLLHQTLKVVGTNSIWKKVFVGILWGMAIADLVIMAIWIAKLHKLPEE